MSTDRPNRAPILWIALALLAIGALLFAFNPFESTTKNVEANKTSSEEDLLEGEKTGLKVGGANRNNGAGYPQFVDGDPVGILELELGSGTIKGTVESQEGPIEFARVQVVLPPPTKGHIVRARPNGTFEVRGLPEGTHDVRAFADGYRGQTVTAPPLRGAASVEVPLIKLDRYVAPTNHIDVRVTDDFGTPIKGAKVLATTMPWDLHLLIGPSGTGTTDVKHKSGVSDELGRARLGPVPDRTFNIVASADGFVTKAMPNIIIAGNRKRTVQIKLRAGMSVSGKVLTPEGKPVQNAIVMGMAQGSFHSSMSVRTDAEGTFTLNDLRSGGYFFVAAHDELGQVMAPGSAPAQGIKLELGGTGKIEGTVLSADGKPVSNVNVRPFLPAAPFNYVYSRVIKTGDDGTFEAFVPENKWTLRAKGDDGNMAADVQVDVKNGETSKIKIEIPESAVVKGIVTDEDGKHVEGAEIYIRMGGFPPTKSREHYATSDAEGRFELTGLATEAVKLHVSHQLFAPTTFQADAKPASKASETTIRLSIGSKIVGRIADADGSPIPFEQVNLYQNFFEARSTTCNAEGLFEFDAVAEGTWDLSTGAFEQGGGGQSKSGVAVGASGTVTVNFDYPKADGIVTGLVTLGGKPVIGARVTVQDSRGTERAKKTVTNEEGLFRVEGVQFGRVQVEARTANDERKRESASLSEEKPSEDMSINISTSSVRARIVDDKDRPVAGAWTNLERVNATGGTWSGVRAIGTSDGDGMVSATSVTPGTYRLRISHSDFATEETDPFEIAADQARDVGTIQLKRGAYVTGRITDDAGQPVEDATIGLKDSTGRDVFLFSMSTTGSDGRYTLDNIIPGRYTIRFEAKGHAFESKSIDVTDTPLTANGLLARGGTAHIVVKKADGTPIEGAKISLKDGSGALVTKTFSIVNWTDDGRRYTGSDGVAEVIDLAEGRYTVIVERSGYTTTAGTSIAVAPGEVSSVDVEMSTPN